MLWSEAQMAGLYLVYSHILQTEFVKYNYICASYSIILYNTLFNFIEDKEDGLINREEQQPAYEEMGGELEQQEAYQEMGCNDNGKIKNGKKDLSNNLMIEEKFSFHIYV